VRFEMKSEIKSEDEMDRDRELKEMYREVESYFRSNNLIDSRVSYTFSAGSWIKSIDGFEYRFDICRECGERYINKRPRGVQYGVHNWWHYCSKGICKSCHKTKNYGISAPNSLAFNEVIK